MFQTIIVHPIYNILIAIYGVLPGHDIGISLIIFTILARLIMWPLLKKQLHQTKVMRDLQPELKKVKQAAGGDKQKEAALMMELYKEKGISPFGSIGLTLVQLPLFIGVFDAARLLVEHADRIGTVTYSFVRGIPHVHAVVTNHAVLDFKSFGFLDLSQKATSHGKINIPILILAILATVLSYVQSKQIMPQNKEKKRLRDVLRATADGKPAAQEDMTAAMSGSMLLLMPLMTLLFALYAQGAMVIYLLASSVIAIIQQSLIFKRDTDEMEAEVVSVKTAKPTEKTIAQPSEATQAPKEKINKGRVITKTRIIAPGASKPASANKKRKKR